ncbi:putative transcriptional regulator [Synechococcus sp. CC9311]|nr:putative transcriptional regulator [Synechococcus sp. CC9311]
MLSLQVRRAWVPALSLRATGVVVRTIYPEVPPRVEYALTDLGRELLPVLDDLHAWGERQADFNSASR